MLRRYFNIHPSILLLVTAEFLLLWINAAFILILNIFLRKQGFGDDQIAHFTSLRFLGVLFLAFPFGIYIRGKRLRPYFLLASVLIPLASFILIHAIEIHSRVLLNAGFLMWGTGFMLFQVGVVPFIMRIANDDTLSEALSLSFSTWSLAMMFSGALIAILARLETLTIGNWVLALEEGNILRIITILSISAVILLLFLKEGQPHSPSSQFLANLRTLHHDYDWNLIVQVITPTLIISIGAGLTIPFINLFFYSVFDMDFDRFSIFGGLSAFLVMIAVMFVPLLKRKLGYRMSIMGTQFLAIFFLVILAFTEHFRSVSGILYLALFCYLIRQPLMNMAGPMISELSMRYVREKNQELVSALNSSIWSASWFISAKIFQYLRAGDMAYGSIFLITALIYTIGVSWYFILIRNYESQQIVVNPLPPLK